jgi:thiol-disulfide isomerase/thioredoxin
MSITGQKVLGVLAVAIGVIGLVGMGIHEVANSCEKSTTTAAAADGKSTTVNASGGSCAAAKASKNASVLAVMAGDKAAGSTCGSKSAAAALASHEAECAAKIASGECTPAECASKKAASANAGEYACSSEKNASAATASAEKSSCSSKEASAALVSAEGTSSSCASKKTASASYASSGSGCSSAKSADYAKAGASCSATASACADFNACSVKAGDLVKAEGDKRKHYETEKAQDGVALTDVKLPEFTAMDLAGNKVNSNQLIGQPTVLVMLATHCGHSYQSQPILQQAAADYESKGLRVVGLVVGTSTEDAKKWIGPEGAGYDVWVTPDASVADALKSHLVPTYVLIDAKGNVKAKLIGFKDQKEVTKNIPVLLVQADDAQESVDS